MSRYWRKYKIRYTHDPKKPWHIAWMAEIIEKKTDEVVVASYWTHAKWLCKSQALHQLKIQLNQEQNTPVKVEERRLWLM